MNSLSAQHMPPHAMRSAQELDPFEFDLVSLLRMVLRRKLVILVTMMISVCFMLVYLAQTPPRYNAKALVTVTSDETGLSTINSVLNYVSGGSEQMFTEAEVLRSQNIAARVIDRLELYKDPEFNKAATKKNQDSIQADEETLGRVMRVFDSRKNIISVAGSSVIHIVFSSQDPQKAAEIANAIAESYLEYKLEVKVKETNRVREWLGTRLKDIEAQIIEAEKAAAEYQVENNLMSDNEMKVAAAEVSDLNQKLNHARVEYAEMYERIREIKNYRKKGEYTNDVLASQTITNLKNAERKIREEMALLTQRYGDKHPLIQDIKTRLNEIEGKVDLEVQNIHNALESELGVQEEKIKKLEEQLAASVSDKKIDIKAQATLSQLKKEADANQRVYEAFLRDFRISDRREGLDSPDARIISYAVAPIIASFPNYTLFIGLSTLMGLFLGLGIALLLEKTSDTFRSVSELEAHTGLPCYGIVPRAMNMKPRDTGRFILSSAAAKDAELIRSIRMALKIRKRTENAPKIITVTSSVTGEGKTTLSTWLGALAGRSGEKVIVLDCDFRRSSLHVTYNKSNNKGLVDYLSNDAGLEDAIYREDPSGVHIIFGRDVPGQALDLINSKRMKALVESLGKAYDLVILDAPTTLAVSDALLLGQLSDLVLYCVAWKKTSRETVQAGLKQFYDAHVKSIATVLGRVDTKAYSSYSSDLKHYLKD